MSMVLTQAASLFDLSILKRSSKSSCDLSESEPDTMKDLQSFTGFATAYKNMTASPDGTQLLFKKNNLALYWYNIEDTPPSTDIVIHGIGVRHSDDTIYDFAFIDEHSVVVILQDSTNNLYTFKAHLMPEHKAMHVITPITPTKISLRKHHSVSLIYDETGPVLVSHPTKFSRGNNQQQPQQQSEGCNETYDSAVIQLLHLHDLYTKEGIRTVSLYPKVKDDDALYCDPFIFRNRLYLFNRFGDNLLCVSIAGSDRSEVRILNTYPDVKGERPSSRYANRCHILLNETLLVYYHQRLDKPDAQPQLWKLELGPLHWNRLQLLLSHHFPIGRVSLRQCSSGAFAFLHGECGRSICQEKAHLYQFSLIQQSLMPQDTPTTPVTHCSRRSTFMAKEPDSNLTSDEQLKRSISSVAVIATPNTTNHNNAYTLTMQPQPDSSSTANNSSLSSSSTRKMSSGSPQAPALRYANRRAIRDKKKRSSSAVPYANVPENETCQTAPVISNASEETTKYQTNGNNDERLCVDYYVADSTDNFCSNGKTNIVETHHLKTTINNTNTISSDNNNNSTSANTKLRNDVHWSEEMAHEGGALTISEQLKLAKDMGYSDEEIMQAVNMNCASDGSFKPFSSTNAMIDMLSRVQRMCDNKSTSGSAVGCYNGSSMICSADSGLELDKSCYSSRISPPRTSTSSGVGVRRATSFHNTTTSSTNRNSANYDDLTSAMPIHEMRYRFSPSQFQLQRLLDAFEKEQKSFGDESKRSIETLEEKCKQFADKQANLQTNLLDRENEIRSLKIQLSDYASVKEQLRKTENELNKQILEDKSKANQIRVLSEEAEMVKRQHELDIRQKEEIIDGLVKKLSLAEGENKPLVEKNAKLLLEIDVLKKQLATKQAELDKCSNYHDEILKAEQRIEQIRLERDEVRSTLSKVPTCVICLDKRPQMLYMPCSHFICCEVCGNRFDHCPTCRQKICGKITVYQ